MVETNVSNINDPQGASIAEPKTSNAPQITDEQRKAIMNNDGNNNDKGVSPNGSTPSSTTVTINDSDVGLSADDLERVNQSLNNFKRELKEDAAEKANEQKRLELEMREKILREIREEEEKKRLAASLEQNTATVSNLQAQIQALQEKINNPLVGQEVPNKSPFNDEKELDSMTADDIKKMDEASRIAFFNSRFGPQSFNN